MKNVAIITLHRVLNYGSVLQTFALAKALELLGHRATVIDYLTGSHRFANVVYGSKAQHGFVLRALLSASILPKFLLSRLRFNAFIARYLRLTPTRYESLDALQTRPPTADVYVTGSDQVWNSVYNAGVDPAFFLAFGPEATRRVSYAASFGKSALDAAEGVRTRELLLKYNALGVRESSAAEILHGLGFEDVAHVVDPTLLLSREQWQQFVPPSALGRGQKYILIHCVNKESLPAVVAYARRLGAKTGYRVRSTLALDANLHGRLSGALLGWHRPTEDFLGLVSNASFVVVDSFHGTVFSIVFNRPFIALLPRKYNTRITSLLKLLGIPERADAEGGPVSRIEQPIDWAQVNARLAVERQKSIDYLRRAVEA